MLFRSRIVFRDLPGYVPTALVALTLDDAERLCDKLNRRLGLDRTAWTALAGRSMFAGADESWVHRSSGRRDRRRAARTPERNAP